MRRIIIILLFVCCLFSCKQASKGVAKQISKEAVEVVEKTAVKKASKQAIKKSARKAGKAATKLSNSADDIAKGAAKASKVAKRRPVPFIRYSGMKALKNMKAFPELTGYLTKFEKNFGPNFNIDKLAIKRTIKGMRIEFKGTRSSIMVRKNGTVYASGGSVVKYTKKGRQFVGELNEFLEQPLPNTRYVIDDYINIFTNEDGLPKRVEVNSRKLYSRKIKGHFDRGDKFSDYSKQMLYSKFDINPSGIDYGHLVRRELGGINEIINALPMRAELQRSGSRWYELEMLEINACKGKAKKVKGIMDIEYSKDLSKYSVKVQKIIDGVVHTEVFDNLL